MFSSNYEAMSFTARSGRPNGFVTRPKTSPHCTKMHVTHISAGKSGDRNWWLRWEFGRLGLFRIISRRSAACISILCLFPCNVFRNKDCLNVKLKLKGKPTHSLLQKPFGRHHDCVKWIQENIPHHSPYCTCTPCQTFQARLHINHIRSYQYQASIPYLDTLEDHVISYFKGETPMVTSLATRHGVNVVALHPPQRHQHSEPGKMGLAPFHTHDLLVRRHVSQAKL